MVSTNKYFKILNIVLTLLIITQPVNAIAQDIISDTPSKPIETLYKTLMSIMKKSKELGIQGRFDKLAPVLENTYDVTTMAKASVGRSWDTLQTSQKESIINSFSRMMIATYANRFNAYDGEYFEINETLDQPPSEKLVKTKVVPKTSKPVELNYIMRNDGNRWRVIDVYLDGKISEIASRRAEFNSLLKSGGPEALINSLQQQGDKLLSSQ